MYVSNYNLNEEWKPVYRHDMRWRELFGDDELTELEISSFGRLRKGNEIIQPDLNLGGYYEVEIDGMKRTVHRLVAEAFLWDTVRKRSRRENVHHINECKRDNRASNLMFCSKAQHSNLHMKQSAERKIAKLQNKSALKNEDVVELRLAKECLEYSMQKLKRLEQYN